MVFSNNIKKQKFINHFYVLSIRLIYVLIAIIFTFISTYYYSDALIYIFIKPFLIQMYAHRFIFTSLLEIFLTYLKFSFLISIVLSFPVLIIQFWFFLIPGLYKYEKKKITLIFTIIFFFFFLSILITYFLILPSIWNFFLSFENKNFYFPLHFEAKINDYLFFMFSILFNVIICFQIPPLIIILLYLNILKQQFLIKNKKFFYLLLLLLGTLLSSPEIISQIILILFFLIFYEIGIFLLYILKNIDKT